MNKTTILLTSILFCFWQNLVLGQTFNLPVSPDYEFKTQEDYAKYEPAIIQATDWLESTPINKETEKRQEVSAFFVKWITGTKVVSVELQGYIVEFSKKNAEFLVSFMAGWAKYKLQNPTITDKVKLNVEGIKSMIKTYRLGGAKKDKNIEKLLTLSESELENWVKDKLKN